MTQPPRPSETATPISAILFIFGAGMAFTVLDTSTKFLVTSGMAAPFVAWMRFAGHAAFAFIMLRGWRNRQIFLVHDWRMQVLRGLALFATTQFTILALSTLQMADLVSISFFAPMLITAIAGPLLGEWAGWRRWTAILAGFAGVLVVTRPGLGAFDVGHAYALVATLCNSLYIILTRHMAATESAESLIFYSALVPVVLLLPVIPFTAPPMPDALHLAVLFLPGIFGGFGHWLLIQAYRRASATALAPYLQLVWTIAAGYVVFSQFPDHWTLIGAGIIVASGLYIVHRERILRLRARTTPNAEAADLAEKL